MKVVEFYKTIKAKFKANNIDESDANALFDYFYNDSAIWRGLSGENCDVDTKTARKISKIAARRIKTREPIYSIIGFSPFYNRFFKTNKHVLKPRLDTEILLANALKLANKNSRVLDLCCGSGILGITLNLERGANATCADISRHALRITKQNVKMLKASVNVVKTNMFNNISGKFDLIVCNPPYIKTADVAELADEVKNFDPRLALDGGPDGLKFYRIIEREFANYLVSNGTLVLEIGYNQATELTKLFKNYNVTLKKDFNNLNRVLIIKRKEN